MQISIYLGVNWRAAVDTYAASRGLSLSEAARELVILGCGYGRDEAERVNAELASYRDTMRGGHENVDTSGRVATGVRPAVLRFRLPEKYARIATSLPWDNGPGRGIGSALRRGLRGAEKSQ